jgi:hypothetical protein
MSYNNYVIMLLLTVLTITLLAIGGIRCRIAALAVVVRIDLPSKLNIISHKPLFMGKPVGLSTD